MTMRNFNLLEHFISLEDVEDGKFYKSYPEITGKNNGFRRITSEKKLPLTSLEGCPKIINGEFYLINTMLTSLQFGPEIVKGYFNISQCNITSLKYGPHLVEGSYRVNNTKLTSLEYCPSIIKGTFECSNTNITSLEYAPLKVIENVDVSQNDIKTLQGIGRKYFREIGVELILPDSIERNILGICKINKLFDIEFLKHDGTSYYNVNDKFNIITNIIHKHLESDGDECMEELIQNGYKDYAKF